jgi:parallel beta-helix repeat protein
MLTNCIIWNNIADRIEIIGDDATVAYSNIQGGWPGRGNININPLFADPLGSDNIAGTEDDDLRLAPSSPCIDAGDPDYKSGPNETDLAGKPRLRKGNPSLRRVRVDMGAYEFQCIIYVDDDAPGDPGPGNILVSDPRENGTEPHPRDNIQEAIDIAKDGYTVLVNGGVYSEPIDYKGKAITLTSGSDVAILEGPGDYAVSFYSAEGSDSILKNFVIKNCVAGVFITGSSPTIRNLTLVNNEYGITAYTWAEPDISNCIFFNNSEADLFQCEARYSCIEDGDQGIGNISVDPLFIDAANDDYHLKSEGWCWSTLTESWTYDYVTSPCIDAGDPACPLGDEPMSVPRDPENIYGVNLRINMGAYGGTSQASMPPVGWTPP